MAIEGQRPSAVVAAYRAGELTREGAAEALAVAAWDNSYTRASMEPGGDYDGDLLPLEGFGLVVYGPTQWRELDEDDYAAFSAAFERWRANRGHTTG